MRAATPTRVSPRRPSRPVGRPRSGPVPTPRNGSTRPPCSRRPTRAPASRWTPSRRTSRAKWRRPRRNCRRSAQTPSAQWRTPTGGWRRSNVEPRKPRSAPPAPSAWHNSRSRRRSASAGCARCSSVSPPRRSGQRRPSGRHAKRRPPLPAASAPPGIWAPRRRASRRRRYRRRRPRLRHRNRLRPRWSRLRRRPRTPHLRPSRPRPRRQRLQGAQPPDDEHGGGLLGRTVGAILGTGPGRETSDEERGTPLLRGQASPAAVSSTPSRPAIRRTSTTPPSRIFASWGSR